MQNEESMPQKMIRQTERQTWPVDLHSHTRSSDGLLEPFELLQQAGERGVRVLAITDHDTVAALLPLHKLLAEAGKALKPVPSAPRLPDLVDGVEITATIDKREIHLLGLGVDIADPALISLLREAQASRIAAMRLALDRLRTLGIRLAPEPFEEMAASGVSVGRTHLARALVTAGAVGSVRSAFSRFLGEGKPARVFRERHRFDQVIRVIHGAGGLSSLAHPGGLSPRPVSEPELQRLRAAGLKALELYHPVHRPKACLKYAGLANQLGLAITGGSDHHGYKGDRLLGARGLDDAGFAALALPFWRLEDAGLCQKTGQQLTELADNNSKEIEWRGHAGV